MEKNPGRESFLVKEGSRYVGGWRGQLIDREEDDSSVDSGLRLQIRAYLDKQPDIEPSKVEFIVYDSIVTLGGTVGNAEVRDRILREVRSLEGVRETINGLRVQDR